MDSYELGLSPVLAAPVWHVVRGGDTLGLCGKLLLPDAEIQPITRIDQVPVARRCADCWTAYRGLYDETA
jgi:hypothetical protein